MHGTRRVKKVLLPAIKGYLHQKTIFCYKVTLKGYLRYKTMTSQNMSYEAQKKFVGKLYSSCLIFNHPMIYQICDVIMGSTWDRVPF